VETDLFLQRCGGRREQRATAFRRAAGTSTFVFDFFGARDVVIKAQAIIVKEFFARFNTSYRVNEDPPPLFPHFTVRVAGMIDPLRFIPANCGIDDRFPIVEPEIVCLHIVLVVGNRRPQNTAASILDDSRPLADRSGGKNTAAVHAGFLYHDAKHAPMAAVFRWLLRSHEIISHVWAKSETWNRNTQFLPKSRSRLP
jgi:hypothetical protein